MFFFFQINLKLFAYLPTQTICYNRTNFEDLLTYIPLRFASLPFQDDGGSYQNRYQLPSLQVIN